MFKAKIQKWGNSKILVLPPIEVDYNEFKEGEILEVKVLRVKEKSSKNQSMSLLEQGKEEVKDV